MSKNRPSHQAAAKAQQAPASTPPATTLPGSPPEGQHDPAPEAAAAPAAAAKAHKAPKEHTTTLKGPDGCESFGHEGEVYEANKDGLFVVPHHIAVYLEAHGFTEA